MKNKTTALLLSIFLGEFGVDRFYLGYTGLGILKLLTAGCFGVLWLIDVILIATGELKPFDGSEYVDLTTQNSNSQPVSDPYETLEKLRMLFEQGVLSEEEYSKLKADCLSKI